MNSLHELLLIIIITIMNKENYGMQCDGNQYYVESMKCISEICDESMNDEEFNFDNDSICLPWKQYNPNNQTWMSINSNQTHNCNLVNYKKNRSPICKLNILWSSTSNSISLTFENDFNKMLLLLFYKENSMCTIKVICNNCSIATEKIKNLFHSCNVTQNNSKNRHFVSSNDLNSNKMYNAYLIPIINNTTIGSIGKLRLKTKIKEPTNVTVSETTSNSISLTWANNSDLQQVQFVIKIESDHIRYFKLSNFNYYTFDNLNPCRKYCFVVSVIIGKEESYESQHVCDTTKHEFDKVEIYPIKSESSTFRFIEWKYSNPYNCPVFYSVEYGESENINITTTDKANVNLTELELGKFYFVKVKPFFNSTNGVFSNKEFFTKEIDDFVEDFIKTKRIFRNLITSIEFTNLDIGRLQLFKNPVFGYSNVEKALKENFDKISKSEQIIIETSYSKNTMTIFITIPSNLFYKTTEFILKIMHRENHCLVVKNHLYEKFRNLRSEISGITLCQDNVNFIEKAFLVSHIRIKGSESTNSVSVYSINLSDNENNGILIQNKCLLILVVILLIIILILMADKKGILSIDELINLMPLRKRRQTNLRNVSSPNGSVQMKGQIRGNSNYGVNRRLLDPNHPQYKLIEEFQKICQESLLLEKSNFTSKVAVLPENMKKNRFKNILPYDQTRVVLQIRNENNDYINASRIPFIDNSELTEYIATQGPLPNTISDFWYMVWEQNISIIVMLTKVYEGVQLKCDQYWPLLLNTEFAFDENLGLSVFMEEEIQNNSFCERKLKIINRNTDEERRVTQIHVQKWNDFSKPENHDFEECLTRFHEITTGNNLSPYLIHCSAGVGRTGTFIALDRLIKKLVKENLNLEIYDVVSELRKFRQNMVQQESQYIFIHEFMDYFLCKFKRQSVECQYDNDFTEIPLN